MLTDNDARIEIVIEPRSGTNAPLRRHRYRVPSAMPRASAAAGWTSTAGYAARLRWLGNARCWVWQNNVDFALVRTTGSCATRSGRDAGPTGGSVNSGNGA